MCSSNNKRLKCLKYLKWLTWMLLSSMGLVACSGVPQEKLVQDQMAASIAAQSKQSVSDYGLKHVLSVADLPGGFVERADAGSDRGDVSLTASGPLHTVLDALAQQRYSVSYVDGVDVDHLVSVSVHNLRIDAAIREVAANAGYVAITDNQSRNITIAKQAAWTFRIPVRLMARLDSAYGVDGSGFGGASLGTNSGGSGGSTGGSMGGSPGGSSGGMSGASSGSSGGGSSVGSVQATFNATASLTSKTQQVMHGGLDEFLQRVAGENALVSVSKDTGYILVRGNGAALNRMRRFINQFVYDNDRRVQIKVSVLEVQLDDSMSYGIEWARVLAPLQNSVGNIALSGASGTAVISPGTVVNPASAALVQTTVNPAFNLSITTATINAVISALRNYGKLSVLTQPTIMAMNRSPVAIFDGTSTPYLGSIMSMAGLSTSESGASASFAESGVSLAVMPDILTDDEAQITLAPTVSAITSMSTFTVQGSQLSAPAMVEKRILMQTVIHNGETVILGGVRTGNKTSNTTTLPFVQVPLGGTSDNLTDELVILLRSTVIPPRHRDALVAESM